MPGSPRVVLPLQRVGEARQKARQALRPAAGLPTAGTALPAPGHHLRWPALAAADDPVAMAEPVSTRRQRTPGTGQGQGIPLLPQERGQQGRRAGMGIDRKLSPQQPLRHAGWIGRSRQLQMQRLPTWKAKKADKGRGCHGELERTPFQCHHRPVGPRRSASMNSPGKQRPSWLNWLILAAFLWSSWQLAGLWAARLHG